MIRAVILSAGPVVHLYVWVTLGRWHRQFTVLLQAGAPAPADRQGYARSWGMK